VALFSEGDVDAAFMAVALSLPLYRMCNAQFVTSLTHALTECDRRPFLVRIPDDAASPLFLTKRFEDEEGEDRLSYDQKVSTFFRKLLLFLRLRAFSSYKDPSVAYLLSQDSVVPMAELYIHRTNKLCSYILVSQWRQGGFQSLLIRNKIYKIT
jgi:hypothetical protein